MSPTVSMQEVPVRETPVQQMPGQEMPGQEDAEAAGSLVDSAYENPDYRDGFVVTSDNGDWADIEQFTTDYFLNQPKWLTGVSMNIVSRSRLVKEVGDKSYKPETAVGAWKVHHRTDREIMFGDDMGFMEYRVSFRMSDTVEGAVEAATVVRYKWRRTGAFYFTLVKPFHRRFIQMALKNAAQGHQ